MSAASFDELLRLLDLEQTAPSRFRGASPAGRNRSVFGGQLLAQALMAAGRTVDDGKVAHSLHAYFLRPGDPTTLMELAVEAVRDGRNHQHRQVVVRQRDREVVPPRQQLRGAPARAHLPGAHHDRRGRPGHVHRLRALDGGRLDQPGPRVGVRGQPGRAALRRGTAPGAAPRGARPHRSTAHLDAVARHRAVGRPAPARHAPGPDWTRRCRTACCWPTATAGSTTAPAR